MDIQPADRGSEVLQLPGRARSHGQARRVGPLLGALLGLALVILGLMCAFLARIYSEQQGLLHDEAKNLLLTQRLRFRIERQVAIERGYLITGAAEFRGRLSFDPLIRRISAELGGRIERERAEIWREISAEMSDYERELAYMRKKNYSPKEGVEFFEDVLRPRREKLSMRLDDLVDLETRSFESKLGLATRSGQSLLWIGFALATLLFVTLWAAAVILKRFWVELEVAKANLEELVAARTRRLERVVKELQAFNYSVAHDLRAPARTVASFSELMAKKKGALDAETRDHLRRVVAAGIRMRSMLDGLLALSRLSQEGLAMETVDLSAIAEDIRNELFSHEPARKMDILISKRIAVQGDPRLLRILLQNLIENAWKFTRPNATARVEFGREPRDGAAAYFVRDDGPGFDPGLTSKLFQPFHRLPNSVDVPGLGLGLASSARIVEAHGGRIWAESRPGAGATFFFTLGESP